MEKIIKMEGVANRTSTYQSYFSHIDINQHVNNAVYLNWVVDSLDEAFFTTPQTEKSSDYL